MKTFIKYARGGIAKRLSQIKLNFAKVLLANFINETTSSFCKATNEIVQLLKYKNMKKLVILLLLCVTFGCSKSNDSNETNIGVSWNHLKSAPSVDISKGSLPEWLVIKINEYESFIDTGNYVEFFRGEWNKRTVYYIYNHFSSCLLCELYYENGEKVDFAFNNELLSNFFETSKNWVVLYKI